MSGVVEVIKEGEIVQMPEVQAREEDLFVLRRVVEPEKEIISEDFRKFSSSVSSSNSRLESWKAGKFEYKKNKVIEDLVPNFHWEIVRARRAKNMGRKDLADTIGVSEEDIKVIEFGEIPSDDFVLISKIESQLGISLRKDRKPQGVTLAELQKMSAEKAREEIEKTHKGELSGSEIEILD